MAERVVAIRQKHAVPVKLWFEPNGKVSMKIVGQRYEQVGEHVSTARYLVGASINSMTDENREAYNDFLHFGSKKGNTGSLKFGIDES